MSPTGDDLISLRQTASQLQRQLDALKAKIDSYTPEPIPDGSDAEVRRLFEQGLTLMGIAARTKRPYAQIDAICQAARRRGNQDSMRSSAAVEARVAHNHEVGGSTPPSATNSAPADHPSPTPPPQGEGSKEEPLPATDAQPRVASRHAFLRLEEGVLQGRGRERIEVSDWLVPLLAAFLARPGELLDFSDLSRALPGRARGTVLSYLSQTRAHVGRCGGEIETIAGKGWRLVA